MLITRINESTNDLILSEKDAWVRIFHFHVCLPIFSSSLFLNFLLEFHTFPSAFFSLPPCFQLCR